MSVVKPFDKLMKLAKDAVVSGHTGYAKHCVNKVGHWTGRCDTDSGKLARTEGRDSVVG